MVLCRAMLLLAGSLQVVVVVGSPVIGVAGRIDGSMGVHTESNTHSFAGRGGEEANKARRDIENNKCPANMMACRNGKCIFQDYGKCLRGNFTPVLHTMDA